MTVDEAMAALEALGEAKLRERNAKDGAGENQFGVNLGKIRDLAKKIKRDHDLALALWTTGNVDARLLAVLIADPKRLDADAIDAWMRAAAYYKVADWLNTHLVKGGRHAELLMRRWRDDPDPIVARAGWGVYADLVAKGAELDFEQALGIIEADMASAPFRKQETMNYSLVRIAVHHEDLRAQCLEIAERLKVFIDYPVPKGCTSPYAPIWIDYLLNA